MKKLLGILVLGLLFGISANAQPSSEYLGNDEWLVKYSSNCTYKGALKGIGKKKGLFKTKQTGIQHGYGIFDCDGGVAEGQFLNGKKHGQGTYVWNNGDRYIGEYKEDIRTGQGTLIWKDGEKYVGQFLNGKKHGQGTYFWNNGDRYIGGWRNDNRYGKGTYIYSNGRTETKYY